MEKLSIQDLALSTFTPSAMSERMLEGIFVQRERMLQGVVRDLATSTGGAKKYIMLVGARGMGKTHFVSLAYYRLKAIPELRDKLIIAWLREEEYGVNSWLYLVVEILRALGEEGIDAATTIDTLENLSHSDAEYLANRSLLEIIGDRTLFILTENLDKLLYGLGESEQYKFRSFLQENNCCSILATTPKISDDTSNREKPFFGFFNRIDLPSFSHRDAIEMLAKIAELSSNNKLTKFLTTQVGSSRVRAIHHLAGGNPRVYALFAQLITAESLESLLPAAIEMLDKLTPYYQSRVESLGQSDDQQKIVMYLVRENRALTVKEIAKGCFISSEPTASNALKKLKQKGYVISEPQGREVFYDLSEVLMRLCLQMKSTRNGNLKLCIDFLKIWFSATELKTRHDRALAGGMLAEARYYQQALESYSLEPIVSACLKDTHNYLSLGDETSALDGWRELVSVLEINKSDAGRVNKLIKDREFDRARIEIESILANENTRTAKAFYLEGLLLYQQNKWQAALTVFDRSIELDSNDDIVWNNRGVALFNLGRLDEAIASYDKAIEFKPDFHEAWNNRGVSLANLGRLDEAIASYDKAIEFKPDYHQAWYNRGVDLGKLGKLEEAIASYDKAIEFKPNKHEAWYNRGVSLGNLGRLDEAISSFDKAIEFKPDDHEAWNNRGVSLGNLGRLDEAIASFDKAIEFKPDDHEAWNNRGVALGKLGRLDEAIASYDKAIEFKPDFHEAWHNRGTALYKLGKYVESIHAYDRAIQIKPDEYESWHDRGFVYFQIGNYTDALVSWRQAFKIIQELKPDDTSDLIQELLDEQLLAKFQQPAVAAIVPALFEIYRGAGVLSELGVALVRNLKQLQSPAISEYTADRWLEMWQQLGGKEQELKLSLKLLAAGIEYKKNPHDRRIFLRMPQEMRSILREAVGIEED
jgi:tetratricopeptide (TPR) repeat protein